MPGIYIHIPFCRKACHYCDFHFSTSLKNVDAFTHALCRELVLQKGYVDNQTIETIYFGGGTPSILSFSHLHQIFETIHSNYCILPAAEITFELNPEDCHEAVLQHYLYFGINRLSIGIQTFDEQILAQLNRNHSAEQAVQSVLLANKCGFTNVTIDLMYGLPHQTMPLWENDIDTAFSLPITHLSAYSLTIEPNTVFGQWQKNGKLDSISNQLSALQMELLHQKTTDNGFVGYEISNFGKEGFFSVHNANYWKNKPYLGVGPSAHSYNLFSRQWNASNNALYIKSLEEGRVPFEIEMLTDVMAVNEALITGLRTMWGVHWHELLNRYPQVNTTEFYKMLKKHEGLENVMVENGHIVLTHKGRMVADYVIKDLFISS